MPDSQAQYGHALPGLEPLDRDFGKSRGEPIDRRYIHEFLCERRADVRGRVLQAGEGDVTQSDVLNALAGEGLPTGAFDCIVLAQTLHLIFDVWGAVATLRSALAPRGVVLATLPGMSQISQHDGRAHGDFWRFTPDSATRLFGAEFGEENVEVEAYGNVLVASAFLYGCALEDLTEAELAHRDDQFPFLIGVRAVA